VNLCILSKSGSKDDFAKNSTEKLYLSFLKYFEENMQTENTSENVSVEW